MINSAQVASNIAGLNERTKPEIAKILKEQVEKTQKVHIYNIYPTRWRRSLGSLGTFYIPACETNGSNKPSDWASYSKPLIIDSLIFEYTDKGSCKMGLSTWDGREVARDITGESEGVAGNDLRNRGVFVAAGVKPTAEELAQAKRLLTKTMSKILAKGDALWAGTQTERNLVGDHHRRAATYLGVQRDWDSTIQAQIDCKFCGSSIKPNLARCPKCQSILDRALWEQGQEGYVAPAPAKGSAKQANKATDQPVE